MTDKTCVFCKIIDGEIPSHKVYEDDDVFAFLDISPINEGHTLVIPKSHTDSLWDLDEDSYSKVMSVVKKLSAAVNTALQPARVGMNLEGFDVAHAHVHVVPLQKGFKESLKTHQPGGDVDHDALAKTAEKIILAL